MPFSSHWIEPELFLEHEGVRVYHIYRGDDMNQGARSYWYTTDPINGSDDDDEDADFTFDVRTLPTFSPGIGRLGELEAIKRAICAAVESGYLKNPAEEIDARMPYANSFADTAAGPGSN